MKLLFVAHQFPYPLDVGSKIRSFNLLKGYSRKFEVTLVCFYRDESELKYLSELKKYCAKIIPISSQTCIGSKVKYYSRPKIFLWRIFSSIPAVIAGYRSEEAQRILRALPIDQYSVVHIQRVYFYENIKFFLEKSGSPWLSILDVDDLESKKIIRESKVTRFSPQKIKKFFELAKWKIFERNILRKFDLCLVCSEKDRKELSALAVQTCVVPNGVDIKDRHFPIAGQNPLSMLYLGAMDYEPNIDAVTFFVEKVFPLIRKEEPNAVLFIAGSRPSEDVLTLHNGVDVRVLGYVDNPAAQIDKCSFFIVPLRVGGGTRIKILEAMSRSKAVVSTSIGCEGIDVSNGENILVADSPCEFADACINLLRNEKKRDSIGKKGLALVENTYRWDSIIGALLDVVVTLQVKQAKRG